MLLLPSLWGNHNTQLNSINEQIANAESILRYLTLHKVTQNNVTLGQTKSVIKCCDPPTLANPWN